MVNKTYYKKYIPVFCYYFFTNLIINDIFVKELYKLPIKKGGDKFEKNEIPEERFLKKIRPRHR